MTGGPALDIAHLSVGFPGDGESVKHVVNDISLNVAPGQVAGLVGESGAGKSMVALAALGLVPAPGRITDGRIQIGDKQMTSLDEPALLNARGRDVGIVFQDPLSSFNPLRTIGAPLIESARRHQKLSRAAARALATEALDAVGIANAEKRLKSHPHEFSGGQRQRIMIALALINDPGVLIADEPTTALDATVQLEILDLLRERTRTGALLIITHDLAMASAFCDTICVMRHGRIVERGSARELLENPAHEYTKGLISSMPRLTRPDRSAPVETTASPGVRHEPPVAQITDLCVDYGEGKSAFRAVKNVSFEIGVSESVGLVGESGSGKSTIARALLGIRVPSAGRVFYPQLADTDAKARARHVQMIFQDPYASLNPRWTVTRIVGEPLRAHATVPHGRMSESIGNALAEVGLSKSAMGSLPAEFSGGQRQRICIARALVLKPTLIVADEPLAALDMTIQRQILELLATLQREHGMSMLLITHDLSVVANATDRLLVMFQGQVIEAGTTRSVLEKPLHPYTVGLLASVPNLVGEKQRKQLVSSESELTPPPADGCAFASRCPLAVDRCRREVPRATGVGAGRTVTCHRPGELDLWGEAHVV